MGALGNSVAGWDFFISYTAVDSPWAEWLAWQLESADYRVLIQAWDFVPGSNWRFKMQQGVMHSTRMVAVLSTAYLTSVYGQEEWGAVQASDPHGLERKLLPVRIEDCARPGLLGAVVSIDLFDLPVDDARDRLLTQVRGALAGRVKPEVEPAFPVRPRQAMAIPPPAFPEAALAPSPGSFRPRPLGVSFFGHRDAVWSMAFTPDSRTLAVGLDDGTVWLWDVTDPLRPQRLSGPLAADDDVVWSVTFVPDRRTLAIGGSDGTVRLWNLADPHHPDPIGVLTGSHEVDSMVFAPDGRTLAVGGSDGTVRLWDVADPHAPHPLGDPLIGRYTAGSLAFASDGRTLAVGNGSQTLWVWDIADPHHLQPLGEPFTDGHMPESFTFAPNGRTIAAGFNDGIMQLWDVADPHHPRPIGAPLTSHSDAVLSVVFAPDSRTLATGSGDGTVHLWRLS